MPGDQPATLATAPLRSGCGSVFIERRAAAFLPGFPVVRRVVADGGHAGRLVRLAEDNAHAALEIVGRLPGAAGFVVIRRRWVVERAFAGIMKCRRLVRGHEQITRVAEALVTAAAIAARVRRR